MTETKIVRVLAALIFLLGLLYCAPGVLAAFFTARISSELRELAQYSNGTIPVAIPRLVFVTAIAYGLLGGLMIAAAVGMFRVREWARKLWLGLSVLIVALNLFELIKHYANGMIDVLDWIGVVSITAVAISSWYLLTRPSMISLFRLGKLSNDTNA